MIIYTKSRASARGAALPLYILPLFAWAQTQSLLREPVVRHVQQRVRVSPALALVLSELAGLGGLSR
jgi:hypothetical protein